jgi:hypothetical protein
MEAGAIAAMGRVHVAASQLQRRLASLGATASMVALACWPAAAAERNQPYPSNDLFRRLQLDVLDCGRDNNASSCDAARRVADPLLDHPRLPASCKDLLWTIRQRAVVAPSNSFNRREQLNRAAADITPICRQRDAAKPAAKPDDQRGPSLRF